MIHLFNHCLRLSHFPKTWKEAKFVTLPIPDKDPRFSQNSRPTNLLYATSKLFEKVIVKIVQRHDEDRGLLNASPSQHDIFTRDKPILLSETILYKGYGLMGPIEKRQSVCDPQGAWRQDELIAGKPPVVNSL
jgi:hypothetical protein